MSNSIFQKAKSKLAVIVMLIPVVCFANPQKSANVYALGQLVSEQQKSQVKENECILKVGIANWPPYQWLTTEGKAKGKQIELVEKIFKQVGCKFNYVATSFPHGLDKLKEGSIDIQLNATPSPSRAEYSYFSLPYRKEFLLLYSTNKYLQKCQTMSLKALILDGFKLAAQKDLVYGDVLTEIQQDPELNRRIFYVDSNVQHVDLIEANELDGVIDDPIVVAYRSTVNATGNKLSSCPIVISSAPISFIFSKKTISQSLVDRFNQTILEIQDTREYQQNWSW